MAELIEKTRTDSEPSKPFVSKALGWAAWPVSGVIGWWWGNQSAKNSLYDTLKHSDKFAIARKGSTNGIVQGSVEYAESHWGKLQTIVKKGFEHGSDIITPLRQEHSRFDKETAEHFKKLGFNHTLDYLRGIHRSEAIKAIMTGVGAGGITLGVITMLADHEGLKRLFSRKEKKDNERAA